MSQKLLIYIETELAYVAQACLKLILQSRLTLNTQ